MKHAQLGTFVFAITAGGSAVANCPGSMPQQLLEDCIVYEGAGSSFPTDDYAHMDVYNSWLKEQKLTAKHQQAEISAMEKK